MSTQNQYLAFDATSLKQLIIDRLNEVGAFTDQNYEGSNIASLIDIFAYTFQSLIFYNNRTSTNTLFSDTNVYENMNRIVKLIDYKPIGAQTSTLTFNASAQNTLAQGGYVIPRYTFFRLNNIIYSFNTDITFTKTTSGVEFLRDMSNQNLLYQGKYIEYPPYTAIGSENETFVLAPGDNVVIDHFNIDVYVKDATTGLWSQWNAVPTLFFENKDSKAVEIRLNENKRYEVKFGNNINGKKLNVGDTIAVYYLETKGTEGEVGIGAINNKAPTLYNTSQFNAIAGNIYESGTNLIGATDLAKITFTNTSISTSFGTSESVDSIRSNAPKIFRSQFRLVTLDDYEAFIRANFSNIIRDVKLTNNWGYTSEYIKYFKDLGLTNPNRESRVFFNQLMFADACNFNNVYAFVVPRIEKYTNSVRTNYLTTAQKEVIINTVNTQKTTTAEVVLLDPVYIGVSVGVAAPGQNPNVTDKDNSYLSIVTLDNSRDDLTYIRNRVKTILQEYFANTNCTLGQTIDIAYLNDQIIGISGVKRINTRRKNSTAVVEGLSLQVWNPVYSSGDIKIITKNETLDNFKFPFLFDVDSIVNNIVIEDSTINQTQAIEY
jgi:hypothetical protein